jgi:hypothetical protein
MPQYIIIKLNEETIYEHHLYGFVIFSADYLPLFKERLQQKQADVNFCITGEGLIYSNLEGDDLTIMAKQTQGYLNDLEPKIITENEFDLLRSIFGYNDENPLKAISENGIQYYYWGTMHWFREIIEP